jgi:dihydroneopterin aldolase
MKTKVSIVGAEFYAFHGYYEEERKAGNIFILDAQVTLKTFDTQNDDINDTVNYEWMYEICKEEMMQPRKLLETVVFSILQRFQSRFENITDARVKLEKVGPQLGGKVEKSVIEMEF